MKLNRLVDRAPDIYRTATNIFGTRFVSSLVHNTYCKVFTAGSTVAQANESAKVYQNQGNT
jgi:hypothetical protein